MDVDVNVILENVILENVNVIVENVNVNVNVIVENVRNPNSYDEKLSTITMEAPIFTM